MNPLTPVEVGFGSEGWPVQVRMLSLIHPMNEGDLEQSGRGVGGNLRLESQQKMSGVDHASASP